jgi:hypothetical protein
MILTIALMRLFECVSPTGEDLQGRSIFAVVFGPALKGHGWQARDSFLTAANTNGINGL